MKIVIRADASIKIGTGHVMRCLTLAQLCRTKGIEVSFICRRAPGNLIDLIQQKDFTVHVLQGTPDTALLESNADDLTHASWLGVTQHADAQQCRPLLQRSNPDWVVVDHYAIDYRWQQALVDSYKKLLVIDDLADRVHHCDLLLDQNFGRKQEDYQPLVPAHCRLLIGAGYTMLRPEFGNWRERSLRRRLHPKFEHLLITLGGVDADNVTGQLLQVLQHCDLPADTEITVVMGVASPHAKAVHQQAEEMPYPIQVLSGVSNMAELMTWADLLIGAAGSTVWEACCLGLPSLLMVLAQNQKNAADLLQQKQAVRLLTIDSGGIVKLNDILTKLIHQPEQMRNLSQQARVISDGKGADRVAAALTGD